MMLFALVLGMMVGGASVLLLEQWFRAALSDVRPARVLTPGGVIIVRAAGRGRRAA